MNYAEAVQIVREHFESLFPKTCSSCGRRFVTLREYILDTTRVGPARSYDADMGHWETTEPIGSLAYANCPCGSTLTLSTDGIPVPQRLELLQWVRTETERENLSPSALLERLRDDIRKRAVEGPPA